MCKGMNIKFGDFRNRLEWSREALSYAFSKQDARLMNNIEEKLVHDVYLNLQPYQVAMYNASSAPFFKAMLAEIKTVLAQYGGRDLLYLDNNASSISPSLARGALEVCSKGALTSGGGYSVYLVHEKCSMSMLNFLVAMLSHNDIGENIPPKIIEEWSAIPEDKQSEIYEGIVEFIRRNLASAHSRHEQTIFAISS